MKYEEVIELARAEIPEFEKAYIDELRLDNLDENSGVHTVFSFVFVPLFKKAIEENNSELANRLALFLEKMESSGEPLVSEVAEFTVLEELCDDYTDEVLEKYFLTETKLGMKEIRKYILGPEWYS